MVMGAGRFDNVFRRLDVELDRMRRIGVSNQLIDEFRASILKQRPNNQEDFAVPAVRNGPPVTPYAIAVNRFENFKEGKFTWEYVLDAWEKCNDDDKARLNEVFQGE